MSKVLIIVDMQKDFIDGTLENKAAETIIDPICDYIKEFVDKDDLIILTQDTHQENYLETQEGRKLPFKHCIVDTDGWKVNEKISKTVEEVTEDKGAYFINHCKPTFGDAFNLALAIDSFKRLKGLPDIESITLTGTCTDICVVSNALGLKEQFPEIPIRVIGKLCAGLTPEKHKAALEVMRSCQVEVE